MAGALLGAVSCSPVGGPLARGAAPSGGARAVSQGGGGGAALAGTAGSNARLTSGELRQLREQREGVENERLIRSGSGGQTGGRWNGSTPGPNREAPFDESNLPPLPPLRTDYQYALPVPGRNGWVYNPYTNRPVDVRGVESGRLIYDERDPENRNEDGTLKPVAEMPNKFRVP